MSLLALAIFASILLLPISLFSFWRVALVRSLLAAASRMSFQLILVGFYLQTLFDWHAYWINALWFLVMVSVAAYSISSRVKIRLCYALPVVGGSLLVNLLAIVPLMLVFVVEATPWWHAQYLIPITGMVLGNALSANIVGLSHWSESLVKQRDEYQYYLSMGASEPDMPFIQRALSAAMAPQLATMATLGIVSLPGMMTGQILAGAEPMNAVMYQIMIMLAIFVTASSSVALSLWLLTRIGKDSFGGYQRLVLK